MVRKRKEVKIKIRYDAQAQIAARGDRKKYRHTMHCNCLPRLQFPSNEEHAWYKKMNKNHG